MSWKDLCLINSTEMTGEYWSLSFNSETWPGIISLPICSCIIQSTNYNTWLNHSTKTTTFYDPRLSVCIVHHKMFAQFVFFSEKRSLKLRLSSERIGWMPMYFWRENKINIFIFFYKGSLKAETRFWLTNCHNFNLFNITHRTSFAIRITIQFTLELPVWKWRFFFTNGR